MTSKTRPPRNPCAPKTPHDEDLEQYRLMSRIAYVRRAGTSVSERFPAIVDVDPDAEGEPPVDDEVDLPDEAPPGWART